MLIGYNSCLLYLTVIRTVGHLRLAEIQPSVTRIGCIQIHIKLEFIETKKSLG